MKKITVIIGKSKDHFGAYAENVDGLWAGGNSISEVKKEFLEAIRLTKANSTHVPEILKGNYEIEYKLDISALLSAYDGILTKASIERLTGINRAQLCHYASGFRRPRRDKLLLIETSLHRFADDLKQVHLVMS
jgi:hypothetical protein